MKRSLTIMVMFGSLALSQAQNYEAELDPFQEVPPHNTPGYGSAGFSLSGTTLNVTSGSYNDLLGNSTAVTVNDAPAGVNGPVVFSLTLTSPGTTAGTFTGSGTLTPAQITDLGAGNLYVNVSDNVYPSGEIRGQILAAPDEPATMALLGTSSLALLALRRRQV